MNKLEGLGQLIFKKRNKQPNIAIIIQELGLLTAFLGTSSLQVLKIIQYYYGIFVQTTTLENLKIIDKRSVGLSGLSTVITLLLGAMIIQSMYGIKGLANHFRNILNIQQQ